MFTLICTMCDVKFLPVTDQILIYYKMASHNIHLDFHAASSTLLCTSILNNIIDLGYYCVY